MTTAHTLLSQALAAYDAADPNWNPEQWFESVRACLAAEPLSPAWCASVDADAECSVCDAPECQARGCDGQCNSALSPSQIREQAAAYRKMRNVPEHLLGAAGVPCIALPDSYAKGKYLSGLDADNALGIKCLTCNGHGLIGGPSFYRPDEGGEPCPDCNAPAPTLPAAAVAEGAQLDGESLEQAS